MPVWGAVLSDPLPVVGTAGRRPAVYLMGRMPIPRRIAPFHQRPCGPWSYGESIPLSGGCAPAGGRSHTRYAPVRRSPAQCCHCPLPLDLHVLGLPLAFILSQDQTLRCMTFFICYLFRDSDSAGALAGLRPCRSDATSTFQSSFAPAPFRAANRGTKLGALRETAKSFFFVSAAASPGGPGRSRKRVQRYKQLTIDNWRLAIYWGNSGYLEQV